MLSFWRRPIVPLEATEPVSFRNQSGHAYARMYVVLYADSLRLVCSYRDTCVGNDQRNLADLPIAITPEDAEAQLAER